MIRFVAALAAAVLVLAAPRVDACTFCGDNIRAKPTLRMQFTAAKAVLFGTLKNPRVDPKTDEGFTDLKVVAALKDDAARGGQNVVVLRAYIPVIGDTPTEYLAFCGTANGKLDTTFGIPSTPAVVAYLKGSAKLDPADSAACLGFFFKHLGSADPTVAADAFVEFARASDADIARSAKHFDPAVLRKLLADEKTPGERLGVFSYLLGVCGGPTDAAFLGAMLKQSPLPDRVRDSFGGLLAGYVLLAPKDGWALTAAVLGDDKQSFSVRLSSINTVRFFQATRGAACKADVLKCCAALLPNGDFADQAIEDLRRWGYWDLSADVFAQFGKPTHTAPIVRRCIVRYALSCPNDDAKRFLAAVRQADPKLVDAVEEMLKLFEAPK
ncbi:hypothetical protein [Frigoriglobus tundricola]|uniref:HEAT repeat domain-containing protein n=1 Tax=Frigoriglobus tundricola TaxID=2774151 RepID=A0A6M5Z3V2_9BACT|nr:hypothetical protein [Frigoriglobus tundricola]QJX00949.1 hypothetical protein FTUN_8587 [Frigoriglobus tundricola]